jgi:hypothetical protein
MQVNNAGNVGIGTTVPGAKLDVLGGIQAAIIRTSDASTLYTTYQVNSTTVVGYIGNGNGIVSAGGTSNFGIRSEADLLFAAGGNAERVRITSGGNVGIGTTAPAVALDVVGRIILKTATAGLYVYTSGSSFADGIRIGDISTDNGFMYLAYVSQSKYGSIQPGDNLAYRNLNLNHQGGNVGIGFLNPTGKLHISSSTSINHALRIEAEAASDTFPVVYIEGNKSGGAPAVATLVELKSNTDARGRGINMTVADGNTRWFAGVPYLGGGYQIGYDGSANALPFYPASSSLFITTGGSVGIGLSNPNNKLVVNGAIGFASASVLTPFAQRSTNYHTIYEPAGGVALYLGNTVDPGNYYDNTNHYFRNRGGGTTYAIINSAGSVGIGTTSPAYKLDVTGDIRATSDVIAFSDARVKDNVETITNALAKVISLRGVYYNRNDIEDKSRKVGVIAQEVKEILPEVVQQDNKGNYSVAYGNMVSIFIEAIKEQQSQIDDLQKQINYLAENK